MGQTLIKHLEFGVIDHEDRKGQWMLEAEVLLYEKNADNTRMNVSYVYRVHVKINRILSDSACRASGHNAALSSNSLVPNEMQHTLPHIRSPRSALIDSFERRSVFQPSISHLSIPH